MTTIIEAAKEHFVVFLEMAMDLWGEDYDSNQLKDIYLDALQSEKYKVLLCSTENKIIAFIFLSVRVDYVEGSESSPTGYLEGIYVKPAFRKMGIAKKLLAEGEKWIKEKGCREIGSDAYIENVVSHDFHTSVGFKEAGRLVTFIKSIE